MDVLPVETAKDIKENSMSPFKTGRPCPGYGPRRGSCPNLIRGNQTCCSECAPFEKEKKRRYDKKRDESPGRQFLHSTTWRKIRAYKLSRQPLCERCLKQGQDIPATLVHHKDGNELHNHPVNHESLCVSCHELIHKEGRWGR